MALFYFAGFQKPSKLHVFQRIHAGHGYNFTDPHGTNSHLISFYRSLLVFLGAGLGANARYWLSFFFQEASKTASFPVGTLIINVTGSFLIGVATAVLAKSLSPDNAKALIIVGILGGYTTFSSYSLESLNLLSEKNYVSFLLYSVGSVVLGLLAAWLGLTLTKGIAGV